MRHRRAALGLPPRLGVAAGDEMARHRLDAIGCDLGDRSGAQAVGLHQLGRHHPPGAALAERGAAGQREPSLPRTAVLLLLLVPRSADHTSELPSLMRISYSVFF